MQAFYDSLRRTGVNVGWDFNGSAHVIFGRLPDSDPVFPPPPSPQAPTTVFTPAAILGTVAATTATVGVLAYAGVKIYKFFKNWMNPNNTESGQELKQLAPIASLQGELASYKKSMEQLETIITRMGELSLTNKTLDGWLQETAQEHKKQIAFLSNDTYFDPQALGELIKDAQALVGDVEPLLTNNIAKIDLKEYSDIQTQLAGIRGQLEKLSSHSLLSVRTPSSETSPPPQEDLEILLQNG